MNKLIKDFDTFLGEGINTLVPATYQGREGTHIKVEEGGLNDDSWMRPNSDYSNRKWLVSNYEMYQDIKQSMTRFQIGQEVRCVNPQHESNGLVGTIVSFEDTTIRWEVKNSENGVGTSSKQYRCYPIDLDLV